jgi:hypothetical protein
MLPVTWRGVLRRLSGGGAHPSLSSLAIDSSQADKSLSQTGPWHLNMK